MPAVPSFSTVDPLSQGMYLGSLGFWETQGHGPRYTMRHTFGVCILAAEIGFGTGEE